MYDYPSGALHIGHWYVKTPTDAIGRYHRMLGENVFQPIGFDAFGLPAENAAIKNRINPRDWTMANIDTMRRQLRTMGAGWDWSAEVVTCDPEVLPLEPVAVPASSWRRASPIARSRRSTGARTTGRSRASRSRVSTATAGAAARRSRSASSTSGTCGRPRTPTSCSTSAASTGRTRSGIMQTNWIGRSEGAEIVFETAPRPPPGRRGAARLHDAARHAVRGDVHGPRPGAPARRRADCPRRSGGRRGLRRAAAAGPRSTVCRPIAKRPACRSARTRSTRSTASGSRSSSPTTCCGATAPARSWPSRRTTSATSRSRPSSGCRSSRGRAPRRRPEPLTEAFIAHAADEVPVDPPRRPAGRHRADPRDSDAPARPTPARWTASRRRRRHGDRGGAEAEDGPGRPSPTACATGWSVASATGGRRSRSSTARRTASCPSPTRTCRSSCPTPSTTPAAARTRSTATRHS